jgi:hypothetical protein
MLRRSSSAWRLAAPRLRRHRLAPGRPCLALAIVAVLAACARSGDPRDPAADTLLSATATSAGLTLGNPGDEPLAVAVFERETATRVMFDPCIDRTPACLRLPAGKTLTLPYADIMGWTPAAREVMVYTWRVEPNGQGGYRASGMTSRVVPL